MNKRKIKEEEKILTVRTDEPDIKLDILECMEKLCEGQLQFLNIGERKG